MFETPRDVLREIADLGHPAEAIEAKIDDLLPRC